MAQKKQARDLVIFDKVSDKRSRVPGGVMNALHKREAASELLRVARLLVAASDAPTTLFEQAFRAIRDKANEFKETKAKEAQEWLQKQMSTDLTAKGMHVQSLKVSLGKYRGSRFVTSAKLSVTATPPFKETGDNRVPQLTSYLQATYSPKYKLKSVSGGVANFNVR